MNLPENIAFVITSRCNLRCKMCFQYGETAQKMGIEGNALFGQDHELSFSEIKLVVGKINKYYPQNKKPSFLITGGEPFIKRDFIRIIEDMLSKGNFVTVNTNFSVPTKKTVKKLATYKRFALIISIDGPEEIHDVIRNKKNTFNRMYENLKIFYKNGGKIRINYTISKYNYNQLIPTYNLLKKFKGINLCFQHVSWIDAKHIIIQEKLNKLHFGLEKSIFLPTEKIVVPADKISILDKQFNEIKKKAKKDKIFLFQIGVRNESIKKYYGRFSCKPKNMYCNKKFGLTILPNGDVKYCTGPTYGIGPKISNILKSDFKNILESAKFKNIENILQKKFRGGMIFPECVKCCFIAENKQKGLMGKLKRGYEKLIGIRPMRVLKDGI